LASILVVIVGKLSLIANTFLYTHFLSVSDFGVISIFISWVVLLVPVLFLNLYAGFGRILYSGEFDLRTQVDSTVIGCIVIGALGVLLLYYLGLETLITGLPDNALLLLIPCIVGLLLEFLITQYYVFTGRSAVLLALMSLKVSTSVIVTCYFLLSLEENRYLAVLYGELSGALVLLIVFLIKFRPLISPTLNFEYLGKSISYSLPLIFYAFSLTLLSQSDRIMIAHLVDIEAAGNYSFVYNIGSLLTVLSVGVFNAVNPIFFDDMKNKRYADIGQDSMSIVDLHAFIVLSMILLGPILLPIIVAAKYDTVTYLVGGVGLACLMQVYCQIWVRILAYEYKAARIAFAALIGAAANVLLNYIFIPIIGFEVAIFTTFIGYFMMSLIVIYSISSIKFGFIKYFFKFFVIIIFLAGIYFVPLYLKFDLFFQLVLSLFVFIAVYWFYHTELIGVVRLLRNQKHTNDSST
jgi:O-antigen/teichoic acid export membrane protein